MMKETPKITEKPETAEGTEVKAKRPSPRGKKHVVRSVPAGRAYVQASYNNTIITLTDPQGNVLAWSSAGHMGFKGPKKSTPYASSLVVRDVVERAVARRPSGRLTPMESTSCPSRMSPLFHITDVGRRNHGESRIAL